MPAFATLLLAFVAFLTLSGTAPLYVEARNSHRGGNHVLKRGVFAVDTPLALESCQAVTLSWNGTKPPYSVGVLVGDSLQHLGNSSTTSYKWKSVNVAAGVNVTVAVKGSTGLIAYSAPVTVTGFNTTCLSNTTTHTNSSKSSNSSSTSSSTPTFATVLPNATASGIGAQAAGATTTSSKTSGASTSAQLQTSGVGLLVVAAFLALVA